MTRMINVWTFQHNRSNCQAYFWSLSREVNLIYCCMTSFSQTRDVHRDTKRPWGQMKDFRKACRDQHNLQRSEISQEESSTWWCLWSNTRLVPPPGTRFTVQPVLTPPSHIWTPPVVLLVTLRSSPQSLCHTGSNGDLCEMIVLLTPCVPASNFYEYPGTYYVVIITIGKTKGSVCSHTRHSSRPLLPAGCTAPLLDKSYTWNSWILTLNTDKTILYVRAVRCSSMLIHAAPDLCKRITQWSYIFCNLCFFLFNTVSGCRLSHRYFKQRLIITFPLGKQ